MSSFALFVRLVAVMVTALALGSCSETGPMTPSTRPRPPETSTRETSTTPTVPVVANPLDLTNHADKPCGLLTKKDLEIFDFGPEVRQTAGDMLESTVITCLSSGPPSAGAVHLRIYLDSPHGSPLEDAYRTKRKSPNFQPLEILGMPAVQYSGSAVGGDCDVAVGTSEKQGIGISYRPGDSSKNTSDTCELAVKAAEAVIRKLGA